MSKHTDSVEASEKEYQRQLAIAISVGEKEPHISAFIGAWDMYDGLMNDCFMTSKDRAQMRKMLTTLQAHTSQQVENWHKESFDRGLELGQQQVEEAVRKLSPWLQHDETCFLYLEEGTPDQCDCGLSRAITSNHQD